MGLGGFQELGLQSAAADYFFNSKKQMFPSLFTFFLPSLNLVVKVCLADLYVLQVIKLPFLL